MMESINCPVLGCSFSTPANTDAAVVAALLYAHTTTHNSTNTAAKVEKVKRPTTSTAGSSEEWAYFEVRDEMGRLQNSNESDRSRMRSTAVGMLR